VAGGEGGQGDREQDHDHRVRNGALDDIGHQALVGPDSLRAKQVHAHGRGDQAKLAHQPDEDAEPDWIDADSADNGDNEQYGGDHHREHGHEHAQHWVKQDQAQQDGDAADGGSNAQHTFEAAAASYPLRLAFVRRTPDAVGFGGSRNEAFLREHSHGLAETDASQKTSKTSRNPSWPSSR
jgi:hypothetical protein